jgi:hypothetical protein
MLPLHCGCSKPNYASRAGNGAGFACLHCVPLSNKKCLKLAQVRQCKNNAYSGVTIIQNSILSFDGHSLSQDYV